jgi:hypothetical protein
MKTVKVSWVTRDRVQHWKMIYSKDLEAFKRAIRKQNLLIISIERK